MLASSLRVRLFALALLAGSIAACESAVSPTSPPQLRALSAPIDGGRLIAYAEYSCFEWFGWACFDPWGGPNGGPWDNPIYSFCEMYPEACLFIDAGGGQVGNPTVTAPSSAVPGADPQAVPDCTVEHFLYTKEHAYCSGTEPTDVRLTRISRALDRMRAKGGSCAQLAAVGDAVIASRQLRVFESGRNTPYEYWWGFGRNGGALPENGGPSGPEAYIALGSSLTDQFWDDLHAAPNGVTLQWILAHELDHLLGRGHVDAAELHTPNSAACL